jgi:hypothetical protein
VARAAVVAISVVKVSSSSYSSDRGAQCWCRGRLQGAQESSASQTLPPTEVRRKSPAAPAPGTDAPAPRAGSGAISLVAGLASHWATKQTLRKKRGQERND